MSTSPGFFDINKFHVVIGAWSIDGYGKDTYIKVTFDTPSINTEQGVDGHVSIIKSNFNLATIELTLAQTSRSNDFLSTYFLSQGVAPLEPILIKDNNGTTIHAGAKCWVEKLPDSANAASAQDRVWSIKSNLVSFVGGNSIV